MKRSKFLIGYLGLKERERNREKEAREGAGGGRGRKVEGAGRERGVGGVIPGDSLVQRF